MLFLYLQQCKKCEYHPLREIYTHVFIERDTICLVLLPLTRFKISKPDFLIKYYNQDFLMPTTRKQKKARKSRGAEKLSDIENLDVMLGGNHLEREKSEHSDSSRRPDSPSVNAHENIDGIRCPESRENR